MTRELKTKVKDIGKERILFISDVHAPYNHPDVLEFLESLKKKIKPTMVVCVGDLIDGHSVSYHEHDPDLMGPADELAAAQAFVAKLAKIFPKMIITVGNHDSLPARKLRSIGLPLSMLKSYNDIYQAPKGWQFVECLRIFDDKNPDIVVIHGISKNVLNVAMQRGECIVQGHFHTNMEVKYAGNPHSLLFGMSVGCLIDSSSPAFAYDKLQKNRPVIGTGAIIDGVPTVYPLRKDKDGRWADRRKGKK